MHNWLEVLSPALRKAIRRWQQDMPISMALAAQLMREGYDVGALEYSHRP